MNKKKLNRLILGITCAWVAIGLVLTGLLLAKAISKETFGNIFPVGFVVFAVVITPLSLMLSKAPDGD